MSEPRVPLGGPGDEGPIPGLSGLRDVVPPPSLVPSVMRRIAEPAPPSFWRWLLRRRQWELRMAISPVGAGALVVAVGVLLLALPAKVAMDRHARAQRALAVDTADDQTGDVVVVRFVLFAQGAKKVALAGDFNGWDPEHTVLENADGSGTFMAEVRLPRGTHQYMFVVDGEWVTDPAASERRPDGFGRSNAVLRL